MKIRHVFILLIVNFFLIYGCVEQLDPADFASAPFPVVIGLLSPQDDTVSIGIFISPEFNAPQDSLNSNNVVKNAVAVLYDESSGKNILLQYNNQTRKYEVGADSFPISAGGRYKLDIKFDQYFLTASCTIPAAIDAVQMEEIKSFTSNYIQAGWADPEPGATSYYLINGFYKGKIEYTIGWDDQCSYKARLLTDQNQSGSQTLSPLGSVSNYGCNGSNGISNGDSAIVEIIHAEPAYYQYYASVFSALDQGGFGDPVTIYSNITGGQGIFAGCNKKRQSILLVP